MRNSRNGQVLFGRSCGKRNGGLNVFGFQAGKIGKNIFGGISAGQASARGRIRARRGSPILPLSILQLLIMLIVLAFIVPDMGVVDLIHI
jgi:hypothetical protein